jgi:hypothetical protein
MNLIKKIIKKIFNNNYVVRMSFGIEYGNQFIFNDLGQFSEFLNGDDTPLLTNKQVLNNVYLNVKTGLLLNASLELITESSIGPGRIKRSGLLGAKKPPKDVPVKNFGTTIFCKSAHDGYYHWLIECIPRLFFLSDDDQRHYPLFLPKQNGVFKEILQTLKPKQCQVQYSEHKWIFFKEFLLLPFYALPGKGYVPSAFRQAALRTLSLRENGPYADKKIYISRRKAPKRKPLNEEEFFYDTLKPFGFEWYELEDYSFRDQATIINRSKIIVAPHGAGLSNLVFANASTKVLEIISVESRAMQFYKCLCDSIGIKLNQYLIQQPVARHENYFLTDIDSNYILKAIDVKDD